MVSAPPCSIVKSSAPLLHGPRTPFFGGQSYFAKWQMAISLTSRDRRLLLWTFVTFHQAVDSDVLARWRQCTLVKVTVKLVGVEGGQGGPSIVAQRQTSSGPKARGFCGRKAAMQLARSNCGAGRI